MKLKEALINLGSVNACKMAEIRATWHGIKWEDGVKYVFSAIANDVDRAPGNISDQSNSEQAVIDKWLTRYSDGFNKRASCRLSNMIGTIADPIIEKIIGFRLPHLNAKELEKITHAHRLGMSAENILGLLLEEYLADNLIGAGWHCAWGETIKSVDFVNENGLLLQIKNRSNSENSSSSAIRLGTEIKHWYRIRHDRIEYMWPKLNEICGTTNLSEPSFAEYIKNILTSNPGCLQVEQDNPWLA